MIPPRRERQAQTGAARPANGSRLPGASTQGKFQIFGEISSICASVAERRTEERRERSHARGLSPALPRCVSSVYSGLTREALLLNVPPPSAGLLFRSKVLRAFMR